MVKSLRHLYSICKTRHAKKKHKGELITFARFKAIYQAQGGSCVESGHRLAFDATPDFAPSADRIDNSIGYEDGNVRFVLWRVNHLRGAKTIGEFRGSSQDRPTIVLPEYMFNQGARTSLGYVKKPPGTPRRRRVLWRSLF